MSAKLQALIFPVLTMLSLFGVNLSEDLRQTLADNIAILIGAFGTLGSILPSVIAAFRR